MRKKASLKGACSRATALVLLLTATTAQAINLAEFVTDVIYADPRVREEIHAYRRIVEDREIAESGWRPSLDLSATSGRVDQWRPSSENFDRYQTDLTLTQNIFNGFDTTNQIEQAESRVTSAVYQLLDTADNAGLDAVKAYLDVLNEKRLLELAAENVESHERILYQIRERSDAGIGRRSDIEQTEGRLASAKASMVSQQNNLQDALIQAHKLLGRYIRPAELQTPPLPALPGSTLEELISEALDNHPAMKSARENIEVAQSAYQRSRKTNYPQLDVLLQKSVGENIGGITGDRRENSLMFNLSYNLYRGGADAAEQRKKISELQENRAFRARVRRQVIDALQLSWTADQALASQLPYLQTHVEKADQTVDLYHEEFFLQKRDLTDLLNAESELNSARQREAGAHYDGIAARFRIYESLGRLFNSLQLAVDVTDDDLKLAGLSASGLDLPQTKLNFDSDGISGDSDHCDNSYSGAKVGSYGCTERFTPTFGVPISAPYTDADGDRSWERNKMELVELIDDLQFEYKQSTLTPISMDRVLNVIPGIKARPDRVVLIRTHTDDVGSKQYNQKLSERRARSVEQWLIEQGVDPGKIQIEGVGEIEPKATNDTEAGRAINRRAEIQILQTGFRSWRGNAFKTKQVPVESTSDKSDPPESAESTIGFLYFEYKKSSLTDESQDVLTQYLQKMQENTDAALDIRAYTDNIGPADYNLKLSLKRADQIKAMVMQSGIQPQRIRVKAMGESEPVETNTTEWGRSRNRRVELRLAFTPI